MNISSQAEPEYKYAKPTSSIFEVSSIRRSHCTLPIMPVDSNILKTDEVLHRGQGLRNGNFTLRLQDDGNFCLEYKGQFYWGTMTQDKDVQTAYMQGDGNLALRDSNGNFIWGSMQSGGNMKTGNQPYMRLHDNGNIGIYSTSPGDNPDVRIFTSNTELIFFRAVHFINRSASVYTYPLIKNRDGNGTIWDGKANNIWAMVSQVTPGYSQIAIDWKTAYYSNNGTHYFRDDVKAICKLGHNVRWGDDVWVNDRRFVYDEASTTTVHIANYASARDGDAVYEGCSTNAWWDEERMGWDGTVRKPDFNDIKI